jgi:hypothetical protein
MPESCKQGRAITRIYRLAWVQHLAQDDVVSGPAWSFEFRKLFGVGGDRLGRDGSFFGRGGKE